MGNSIGRKSKFLLPAALLLVFLFAHFAMGEEGKTKVAGKVTDENNIPVEGAAAYLYRYGFYDVRLHDVPAVDKVVTRKDGSFSFKPISFNSDQEQLLVRVIKEGLAAGGTGIYNFINPGNLHIFLQAPVTTSGTIIDKDKKPIAGAVVTCQIQAVNPEGGYSYISSDKKTGSLAAVTDKQGGFALNDIPKNSTLNLTIEADGYAKLYISNRSGDAFSIKSGTKNLLYTLVPEARIEGVVLNKADKEEVKGLTLSCQSQQPGAGGYFRTECDEKGNFAFKGVNAGKYRIFVNFPDNNYGFTALAKEVEVAEGEFVNNVTIELIAGGYVAGKVTEVKSGKPVKNAVIQFHGPASPQGSYPPQVVRTGEDGIFKTMVAPGENTLVCYGGSSYQYQSEGNQKKVNVVAGETVKEVNFALTPQPKVNGIVLGDMGKPVTGAEVRVIGFEQGKGVMTDREGRFNLPIQFYPGDSDNKYIVARHEKGRISGMAEITPGYKEEEVKIVLSPAASIKGKVVNIEGKGLFSATVVVSLSISFGSGSREMRMLPSVFGGDGVNVDSEGNFEIIGLPGNNKYSVEISAFGYGQERIQGTPLDCGQTKNINTVVLKPANTFLAGRVVDEDGNPVEGVQIFIQGDGQKPSNGRSEVDGSFRIDKLVEGKVYVSASKMSASKSEPGSRASASANLRDVSTGKDDLEVVLYPAPGAAVKPKEITGGQALQLSIAKCLGVKEEEIKFGNGKIFVLTSFSIYSPAAKRVLLDLNGLTEMYRNKDVLFLGLHDDSAEPGEVQKMIDSGAIKFPIVFSQPKPQGKFGLKIFSDLNITAIPQTIIIDRKGIVKFNRIEPQDIAAQIDSLLKQ